MIEFLLLQNRRTLTAREPEGIMARRTMILQHLGICLLCKVKVAMRSSKQRAALRYSCLREKRQRELYMYHCIPYLRKLFPVPEVPCHRDKPAGPCSILRVRFERDLLDRQLGSLRVRNHVRVLDELEEYLVHLCQDVVGLGTKVKFHLTCNSSTGRQGYFRGMSRHPVVCEHHVHRNTSKHSSSVRSKRKRSGNKELVTGIREACVVKAWKTKRSSSCWIKVSSKFENQKKRST